MKTTVERAERTHWKTGEDMVALRFAHNDHQTTVIEMTVPEAHGALEALKGYLDAVEIEEALDRTVLAMTALGVSPEIAAEVRQTVRDAMDNAS